MLPLKHFRIVNAVLLALAWAPILASSAHAIGTRRMMALHVYHDDAMTKDYGRLDAVMRKLKAVGKDCKATSYDYGGSINCGPDRNWDVLIGFIFAPTRDPDFILIHNIRANGINGGEMPKAQFGEFLEGFLKPAAKPGR